MSVGGAGKGGAWLEGLCQVRCIRMTVRRTDSDIYRILVKPRIRIGMKCIVIVWT